MRRREIIALLGGAAAWPLAARAQQGERMRRVAVLMSVDNPEARTNHAAFVQSLKQLGWVDGKNVRIETRWADGTASLIRKNAPTCSLLRPTRSLRAAIIRWERCCKPREPYQSCLHRSRTRLARASSKQWRGRVATRPVLFSSTTV